MVRQTKAAMVKLFGSKEIEVVSITATAERQIDIKFKTGLVLTKDLLPTIK